MTQFRLTNRIQKQHEIQRPVSLILGAGGARGLAHLGALRALTELRFPIQGMVGASMGSLMASLFAIEGDASAAKIRALDFLNSPTGRNIRAAVLRAGRMNGNTQDRRWGKKMVKVLKKQVAISKALISKSLLPSTYLRAAIDHLIPDIDIRDLPIELSIAAVDLDRGQRVVLKEGSLRRAIRAAMSVPGIFPPVRWEQYRLSDIGNYDTVPCDLIGDSSDASRIIAIDVGPNPDKHSACTSAMDAMIRATVIAETVIRKRSLQHADWVIRPSFSGKEWYEFNDLNALIENGYDATMHSHSKLIDTRTAAILKTTASQ